MPGNAFPTVIVLLAAICLATACAIRERGALEPSPTQLGFRTRSPTEPTLLTLTAEHPADLADAEVRLMLPGDVVAAKLAVRGKDVFSAIVHGVERGMLAVTPQGAKRRVPVYKLETRPAYLSAAAAARTSCTDAFAAQGFSAWIILLPSVPNPYVVSLPSFGSLTFGFNPPRAASTRPHLPGAIPVLHMGGGSVIDVDLSAFSCDAHDIQVNVWDTEGGPKPIMRVMDAAGVPLCGGAGQPPCLQAPPQRQWASQTFQSTRPIAKTLIECEEVHVSTFVLQ